MNNNINYLSTLSKEEEEKQREFLENSKLTIWESMTDENENIITKFTSKDFICPICECNEYTNLIYTTKKNNLVSNKNKRSISETSQLNSSLFECSNCSVIFKNPGEFSKKSISVQYRMSSDVAKEPIKAFKTDSGFDLFTLNDGEDIILFSGETKLFKTNIHINFPKNIAASIRPRSSLNSKGIFLTYGTIDNGYRGDLGIILFNSTNKEYIIESGARIGQLVFEKVINIKLEKVDNFDDETSRNENGFGSTGVK
jgi:dUTP pyrophosphatase